MINKLFKATAALLLTLMLLGIGAWTSPVVASKLIWPMIENLKLRDGFTGITHNGEIETNLFSIKPSAASTAEVVLAAENLLNNLNQDQRAAILFPVDDSEWRRWANIHLATRQGVGLLDMNKSQSQAAMNLLATSLSSYGYQTATDIIKLEGHLADLMNDHNEYGEKRYWFSIMGTPSNTEPWGWQIDGHHLVINYAILGNQVVMTPTFMGSEPTHADTGRFAGTVILEDELTTGLQFINSLTTQQRSTAIVNTVKDGNNNTGELFQDNAIVPYIGLKLSLLNDSQRALAEKLIMLYIGKMRQQQAAVKLKEIQQHWHNSYFAWIGDTQPDSVFYYRFHSPVLLIEYDHQNPVALAGPKKPTQDHVHTVVRTPNGNDYGKDLLRQHLESHPH